MWILETSGSFLEGKKIWLKPGKQYLFGRIEKDRKREWLIQHKTVSRKHFVLSVAEVSEEQVGQIHSRSKITLEDTSKAGTSVDGEIVKGITVELKHAVNTIRPASNPDTITISWWPCNITFGLQKKQIKEGVLKSRQNLLQELDIRAVSEYVPGHTTHLVAQKRNTSKGLQALLEGRHIVVDEYVQVLRMVTFPKDAFEIEVNGVSELELDFEGKWPDTLQYLPPRGREPTEQPDEAYKPNPERCRMFDKHTFFFFTKSQYDSLLPVVTTGHGKALMLGTKKDVTTIDDGYKFVQNAIGTAGKAVIVQSNIEDDESIWLSDYIEELSLRCGQISANQSDFLDAILAVDASKLCKQIAGSPRQKAQPESRKRATKTADVSAQESDDRRRTAIPDQSQAIKRQHASVVPSPQIGPSDGPASQNTQQHESEPHDKEDDNPRPKKRTKTEPVGRTLQKFDDGFDPDAIEAYEEDDEAVPDEQLFTGTDQNPSGGHVRSVADDEVASEVKIESTQRPASRSTLTKQNQGFDDDMDELLPGVAAMRREMASEEAAGRTMRSALVASHVQDQPKIKKSRINVRETIRAQREAEDEAERKQRQRYEELQAEDVGKTGPSNLALVKQVSMPVRQKPQNEYRGEQWKSEWEGRKNFKKFKRARDKLVSKSENQSDHSTNVIPSVTVIMQSRGLGNPIWVQVQDSETSTAHGGNKSQTGSQRSKGKSQTSQFRRVQEVEPDSDFEDEHVSPETTRLQQEAETVLDHPVDVNEPRQTRHTDTQTQSSTSKSTARVAGSKRPASSAPSSKSAPDKRQRTLASGGPTQSSTSAAQDDHLKFKFIKRNRNKDD